MNTVSFLKVGALSNYTSKQHKILEFILLYRRSHHVSPTLAEIAEHFGVSKVTIHGHIHQLEQKGAVERTKHRARSLNVLDSEYLRREIEEQNRSKQLHESRDSFDASHSVAGLPQLRASTDSSLEAAKTELMILGNIAAGRPIEAIEDPEVYDLADLLPIDREHYALRVRGNSMIDDGIHDGDLVIVENRQISRDGEVVVAILDGEEATLKRLYHEDRPESGSSRKKGQEGSKGQGRYRLQPANDALDPIFTDSVEVRGVVVGVVRRM